MPWRGGWLLEIFHGSSKPWVLTTTLQAAGEKKSETSLKFFKATLQTEEQIQDR